MLYNITRVYFLIFFFCLFKNSASCERELGCGFHWDSTFYTKTDYKIRCFVPKLSFKYTRPHMVFSPAASRNPRPQRTQPWTHPSAHHGHVFGGRMRAFFSHASSVLLFKVMVRSLFFWNVRITGTTSVDMIYAHQV